MTKDDITYVVFFYSLVVASIIDRFFVIDRHKGHYGAGVGMTALLFLCGSEILYPLVNVGINTIIILCFSRKRWSGILSFIFTSAYLFYFRYYCFASSLTNMFMMSTTLKMMSVAIDHAKVNEFPKHNDDTEFQLTNEITFEHLIFYALHYIGLVGVPFYTYKTYSDYINLPFKHHSSDWQYKSWICVIDSFIVILGRQLLNYFWPFSYFLTDEFLEKRSIFYRIWIIYPLGFDFVLRIYNAFIMANIPCYISGLGAYPDFTKPECGHGPTINIEKMKMLSKENLHDVTFSYKTIENAKIKKVYFLMQFKKSIKYWNRTIQFWLYKYVFKMVPYNALKKPATMLFSSYWHGLQLSNLLSLFFVSLIIYIEERWENILKGKKFSSFHKCIRTVLKIHILYNLITIFISQEWNVIVRYQSSVYWNYIVILSLLLLSSFFVRP
ncbi:lysophospholipid acyltransferase 7-like [Harmonia axyridis]|uniref:lysophospholipid acyltransferase 7-like n=1 Tax=Harmonia axyridis TaxID=115357 RepID=UPI001E276AA1|nr:lysophospholipid acyltransferase 7-like [Harmonia axyridis]